MPGKLSRRAIAHYFVESVVSGVSVKKLARQLAAHLIETKRTDELELVLREIQYLLAEKGYVIGTVTAARELSAATKQMLEAYAQKKTGAQQVQLDTIVDESVLGGVKLDLPGRELDLTIARQLTMLKTKYKKA